MSDQNRLRAAELRINLSTIKTHIARLMTKLEASTKYLPDLPVPTALSVRQELQSNSPGTPLAFPWARQDITRTNRTFGKAGVAQQLPRNAFGVPMGLAGQNANQCNAEDPESDDFEPASSAHVRTVKQRQVRLTEARVMKLVEARLSGLTINQLAAEFGIHRTTVMRHLSRHENDT